jgi:hypothetical protein
MDPEELAAALAGNQQQDDHSWDGRTATNPQTGERIIWRGNRRTGRFVAMNYETADPQSRERVEAIQNRADIGGRTLGQARQFVQRNFEAPTGGVQNALEGIPRALGAAVRPNMFSQADQLSALSNQMIGSNWQPGTSTMMNTATEQEMIRRRYPSPSAQGPANMETYLNMAEEVAVQRAAANSMREWLSERPNLQGWEESFAQTEQRLRQQARAAAQREMFDYQQRRRSGRQGGGAPQWRDPGAQAPAQGGSVEQWERGPDGRMRRVGQ